MRARLVAVFLVPLIGILLVLGAAYGWSVTRNLQQEFYSERLGDVSYFVTSAREALRSDNPALIEGELQRYRQLYGITAAVVDRAGDEWVSNGLDPAGLDEQAMLNVRVALSGRRGDIPQVVLPWSVTDVVIAEPIFDGGDVIGAVVTSSNAEALRSEVARQWVVLGLGAILASLLGIFVVVRLANWVVRPVARVDEAMTEIEHGHMEARIDDDTGPPELRRMISVFNAMAEEVEQVVSRQQEFVLNASHELRNPLNALLVRIEHLGTGLSEAWTDDLEETREEGRRMTRILDTLLSLAKCRDPGLELSPVDLTELVERRVEAWRDVASDRGVGMTRGGVGSILALADETLVESALDAVIDNAVKFSPHGTTVEVSTRHGDDSAVIEVRDSGPGLAQHEVDRATSRFWRSPEQQNKTGSGLGLAIATDLLGSIKGELAVAVADDGGLVVSFHLPIGEPV